MDGFPILIIFAAIIVVIVIGYVGWLKERQRREELYALAREFGWGFDPAKDRRHDNEYANFAIFRRGHSRAAYNTLHGFCEIAGHQCPVKMGDFTYKVTSGSGKNRSTTTYNFSYLIVHMPFMGMPDLLIRPEGITDKIAAFFGFADISFESAEFSRQFYVKSADRRFAYDVVTPRMMEFLMRTRPPIIDIEHARCCLSDGTSRWTTDEFRRHIRWTNDFFNHWPEHVTSRLLPQPVVPFTPAQPSTQPSWNR